MPKSLDEATVYTVDVECVFTPGEPHDMCSMVIKELHTGVVHRHTREEMDTWPSWPYQTGPETIYVGFNVQTETAAISAMGWEPHAYFGVPGATAGKCTVRLPEGFRQPLCV